MLLTFIPIHITHTQVRPPFCTCVPSRKIDKYVTSPHVATLDPMPILARAENEVHRAPGLKERERQKVKGKKGGEFKGPLEMVLKAKRDEMGHLKEGKKKWAAQGFRVQCTHTHTLSLAARITLREEAVSRAGGSVLSFSSMRPREKRRREERRESISGDEEAPKHRLAAREFSIFHRHAMP